MRPATLIEALATSGSTRTGDHGAVQMIDASIVRVHQHGACIAGNSEQLMGRSRDGLTTKIHAVVETRGLPVRLALTAAARVGPSKTTITSAC